MSSTQCPHCGLKFSETESPTTCPNCGNPTRELRSAESAGSFVGRYFRDVWEIITRPSHFFRRMPLTGGMSGPLAFALVTHWIGAAFAFIWHLLIGGAISRYFEDFFRIAGDVSDIDHPGKFAQWMDMRERVTHWFWGAGSVIADPFLTLASIFFASFLVWIGARILVSPGKDRAPREITFESALRLVCYGMSPSILAGLPLFGWGLASLLTLIVTIIGAKEVYRTTTGRAIVIALFPKLVFLAVILLGVFVFAFALAQLLMAIL